MEKAETKKFDNVKAVLKKLNSAFIVLAVIAILIIANILADMLPWTYDMTTEKIFTLSEQTKDVLGGLKSEVNVIAFSEEGAEDQTIKALLEEYRKYSGGKLKIEFVDADKNPAVVRKYDVKDEGISNGTIVFESNGTIRKVKNSDIYLLQDYAYGKAFNGEQQFTGAIIHVTSGNLPKLYFLEGHKESDINTDLTKLKARIEGEAHVVESLNILKTGAIPDDADTIIVVSPKNDLEDSEKEILKEFLIRGGRALFLFDILAEGEQLPNFNSLLLSYGIQFTNNFVVEEDSNSFYANNKMYLIPYYTQHSVVEKLNDDRLFVLFPFCSHIEIGSDIDRTVMVEKLLQTSDESWIRYNINDSTPTKTGEDKDGPAVLAAAATKDNTDLRYDKTKIIVAGNAMFTGDDYIDTQGNFDFFMNAVNWVRDRDESIAIRPKLMNTNMMFVKGEIYIIVMAASVLLIPLLAFLAGFIVWIKRRHL
jgi:ABC-2 type transport system permease protein